MQLIMDTEPSMDIQEKMSTIEEPLDTNLKDSISSLKNDIVNGNKENIMSQKNVVESVVEAVNGEDIKDIDSELPPTEIIESVNAEEENNGNIDAKTEDVTKTNNSESNNSNGVNDTSNSNGDTKMAENISGELVAIVESIQQGDINKKNSGQENTETEAGDQENDIVEEKIENISLSNEEIRISSPEEDSNMDTECLKLSNEDVISDCLVKNNIGADIEILKAETQNLDPEVISEIKAIQTDADNIEVSKECEDIPNTDTEVAIEEDSTATDISTEIDTIQKDVDVNKTGQIVENILEKVDNDPGVKDIETFAVDAEEAIDSDTITKALEVLDSDVETIKNIDNTVTATNTLSKDGTATEDTTISKDLLKDSNNDGNKVVNNIINDESGMATDESDTRIRVNDAPKSSDVLHEAKASDLMDCEDAAGNVVVQNEINNKEEILDVDEFMKDIDEEDNVEESTEKEKTKELKQPDKAVETKKAPFCKLSNTLDILSDDEELPNQSEPKKDVEPVPTSISSESTEKQCINIVEDDDDIMLIDEEEEADSKKSKSESEPPTKTDEKKEDLESIEECTIDLDTSTDKQQKDVDEKSPGVAQDVPSPENELECKTEKDSTEVKPEEKKEKIEEEPKKPLVAEDFLKGYKKNLTDMTRDDLEEFCIIKIVESIVDRSNLSDIKSKLKTMAQGIEEYKKKAMMLTKQNRDLQLVLKSVQEEQKKKSDTAITPLKITRSVGMQVLMTEKHNSRKKGVGNPVANLNSQANNKMVNRTIQSPRPQKPAANSQQIPVPRLVPANAAVKGPNMTSPVANNATKNSTQAINGMKHNTPPQKAEKRSFNRTNSVTVDLTDDEPPTKVTPRSSPAPPVRLVSPQNLLSRPQFTQSLNSPRKVYIPISGPQGQNIRPGQTIMLKSVPPPGQRLRGPGPHTARMPQNQVRLGRTPNARHPAPLPECMKQYQPPNWKALPPAPDLKLSKVENGIVISWKIEGYQEDSYEDIASYQLYAYQETSSPPSTALWKKIGDVKALPLPMACTLTQFMAGFKYYFAVRAVDVRSRLGPFSLPGSILLLNKM